jgi:hypothetical protein
MMYLLFHKIIYKSNSNINNKIFINNIHNRSYTPKIYNINNKIIINIIINHILKMNIKITLNK